MSRRDFEHDLERMSRRGMRKSLDVMRQALTLCSNPELAYPIAHVAGTNGKGSSCTFLAQILAQNGYKVGLALSPHVEDERERIQIWQASRVFPQSLIPTADLLALHADFKKQDADFFDLTYFEYFILLALEHFRREHVDIVILETGLGGRWDATNACPSIVSGIVSVGLDHMAELGGTVEKILLEKIQIAKPGSDFVFAPTEANLVQIAQAFCQTQGVGFYPVVPDTLFQSEQNLAHLPKVFRANLDFSVALAGRLRERGFRFDAKRKYNLFLPQARFEILSDHPLIVLDGAHNEPALRALKVELQNRYGEDYDLVFGCVADRDANHLAKIIIPKNGQKFWLKFPAHGREASASVYESLQTNFGGLTFDFSEEFSRQLHQSALKKPLVACGSFYLCSAFRAFAGEYLL